MALKSNISQSIIISDTARHQQIFIKYSIPIFTKVCKWVWEVEEHLLSGFQYRPRGNPVQTDISGFTLFNCEDFYCCSNHSYLFLFHSGVLTNIFMFIIEEESSNENKHWKQNRALRSGWLSRTKSRKKPPGPTTAPGNSDTGRLCQHLSLLLYLFKSLQTKWKLRALLRLILSHKDTSLLPQELLKALPRDTTTNSDASVAPLVPGRPAPRAPPCTCFNSDGQWV